MIESSLVLFVVNATLVLLVVLTLVATYRVVVGPSPADRLQSIDAITLLLIAIIVLLALVQGTSLLLDVALALAAFGFVAIVAISRYLCEGRIF
jgi:multisubunit Na+/H+ antiporter MnhF subunit